MPLSQLFFSVLQAYIFKIVYCDDPRPGCQASTGWRQRAGGLPHLREEAGNGWANRTAVPGTNRGSVPWTAPIPSRLPATSAPRTGSHAHAGSASRTHLRRVGNRAGWGFKARAGQTEGERAPAVEKKTERIVNCNWFLSQHRLTSPAKVRPLNTVFWHELKLRKGNCILTMCHSLSTGDPPSEYRYSPFQDSGVTAPGEKGNQLCLPNRHVRTFKGPALTV